MPLRKRVALPAAAALISAAALASTTGTAHAAAPQLSSQGPCKIIASAANIRASDNTSSTILGIGYKGQGCVWYSRRAAPDNWYWFHIKMNTSHVTGWVRGDLIDTP